MTVAPPRRPPRRTWVVRLNWYHPEWTTGVAAAVAWTVLVLLDPGAATSSDHHLPGTGAAHAMPGMPAGSPGPSWAGAVAPWLVMAVAMMLPSLHPVLRTVGLTSRWNRRHRAVWVLAACYLAVWAGFGLAALTVLSLLPVAPPSSSTGVLLLAGAAWVATPLRRACLAACHRTVRPPGDGWRADRACAREGLRQGLACVGTCWPVMLAATVAPHDLLLMVALTVVVVTEKVLLDRRRRLAGWTAAALAATGIATLLA